LSSVRLGPPCQENIQPCPSLVTPCDRSNESPPTNDVAPT
jgi:hypothetical protein